MTINNGMVKDRDTGKELWERIKGRNIGNEKWED